MRVTDGTPGPPARPRRATLKDVAARAGLSVMVASYTFSRPERVSEASRERILEAARELGYQPNNAARTLRTGASGLLGVVVSEHLTYAFSDPGATRFLAGVAEVCVEQGKGMVLLPTGGGLDAAATVTATQVDGYVFWTTYAADPALAAAIGLGLPVCIQGGPEIDGVHCVSIDDREAAHAVSQVALAHAEHPAVISFPGFRDRRPIEGTLDDLEAELPVTAKRLGGVTNAVREARLAPGTVPCVVLETNDRAAARTAAHTLLQSRPETDAIICLSDQIALGVQDAVSAMPSRAAGRVIITGFDGDPHAVDRGIVTVRQDLHQQGRTAAQIALGVIASASAPTPSWGLVNGTRPETTNPETAG